MNLVWSGCRGWCGSGLFEPSRRAVGMGARWFQEEGSWCLELLVAGGEVAMKGGLFVLRKLWYS